SLLLGEFDSAVELLRRAMDLTDDWEVNATAAILLAWVLEFSIGGDESLAAFEEALAIAERRPGETAFRIYALSAIANAVFRRGDLERAGKISFEVGKTALALPDHITVLHSIEQLAWVAEAEAHFRSAALL